MLFLGKEISTPLTLASGILGISFSSLQRVIRDGAGMVTTKSLSIEPRIGHEGPVIAEFDGGLINSVGLTNPGIAEGLEEVEKFKRGIDGVVIVSVFGANAEEFVQLASAVNDSSADILELNLSCPNVEDEFKRPFALMPDKITEIVSAVKAVSNIPVLAKLSPNANDISAIAALTEAAGADGLTMINTLGHGMVIDAVAKRPVLRNNFGGISGPCIKPLAIKLIHDAYKVVNIPILGTGGVSTGLDAIEMMMAGASAIGVGSAVYDHGLDVFKSIREEMEVFMDTHGYTKYSDLIGILKEN
ncbi:MAG: dihydroorotate dehydrogenase [Candidatus Marinimicrobia bacterium]|nr:dihydroorotate dehydrogenase [Candidatus Neomarinimicrobiota bacterium]MBT4359639.1 dihydroorotate dehydrogenase [Candidatus Neomarinimicrobiota bacterium]MBT4713618.1 dihydroorotate dehydrogenase [Candidatus Neomarinimicrobiota bacterium]MBT4947105.1 dihydroorotate dehydrogenase [Candidatus Neomarinimicrobiota bacterium]MBT5271377.1 dihydroorotate dehydrogenase [Candidatus Neomarinimicrobiota bacterium]